MKFLQFSIINFSKFKKKVDIRAYFRKAGHACGMNKKGHVLKKLGWFKAKSHLTKANFKFFKCKSAKLKKGIKHVSKALAIDILFH